MCPFGIVTVHILSYLWSLSPCDPGRTSSPRYCLDLVTVLFDEVLYHSKTSDIHLSVSDPVLTYLLLPL